MGARSLAVGVPLPLVEVWEELQPKVERLTGLAGLQIIGVVIEDEVRRREGAACGNAEWLFPRLKTQLRCAALALLRWPLALRIASVSKAAPHAS